MKKRRLLAGLMSLAVVASLGSCEWKYDQNSDVSSDIVSTGNTDPSSAIYDGNDATHYGETHIVTYNLNGGTMPSGKSVSETVTSKTQIKEISGINSEFEYVLSYNGKIEGYVGNATIKLTDKLPYTVKEIKYDENACSFNKDTDMRDKRKTFRNTFNREVKKYRPDSPDGISGSQFCQITTL